MKRLILLLISTLISAPILAAPAEAFLVRPATTWGYTFAGEVGGPVAYATPTTGAKLENRATFEVTYTNFPEWAKVEMQRAIDVWAKYFDSSVPIQVDASWGRTDRASVLGYARPGSYFSNFVGAPDATFWYPSALANALAGKDLDRSSPEIVISVNSDGAWNTRGDGAPTNREYDLESVFIHEICHGLGFLSTNNYSSNYGLGTLQNPTPFDAFVQTPDGTRISELPSPSPELGRALTNYLVWSGPKGIAANNGVAPKLYSPSKYESGSSISHLDEATFGKTGADSVMTPNLDAGEVFKDPGPIALAMMEDMRAKPPAGVAKVLPLAPTNARALIGDKSAIITFDAPINARAAQVTGYVIKNIITGEETNVESSPATVPNLKNGSTYGFTVAAKNSLGLSEFATTNTVTPAKAWSESVIDRNSDAKALATTVFKKNPAIAYVDSQKQILKIALWNGRTWNKTIIEDGEKVGSALSVCTDTKRIHIFYTDTVKRDLFHATFDGKKVVVETIDGDGPVVQSYKDLDRIRTASNVSVSNACVITKEGIQVFYRDESQGILLGAIKSPGAEWEYELVDGDRKTDGRTEGDVGFHLKAINTGGKTYLIYDSVTSVNTKRDAISGEIRLAIRKKADFSAWEYQTLDSPRENVAVAGYDVDITKSGKQILATWMTAPTTSIPNPDYIRWQVLGGEIIASTLSKFGNPNAYLALNENLLLVNCELRLCVMDTKLAKGKLVSSWQSTDPIMSDWIQWKRNRYAVAGINGRLVALK